MRTQPGLIRRLCAVSGTLLLLALGRPALASCGSAFCNVNTYWDAQGVWSQPGLGLDLRYEYIDQDQPRHGSDKVAVGEIPAHHDEVETRNRNWRLTGDYMFDPHWGVTLSLPLLDRSHTHIHHHHGAQIPEHWDYTELGDLRVLGRYLFSKAAFQSHSYGLRYGLKLPTGSTDVSNDEGELAERSLQPGTGTTDLILGAYVQGQSIEHPLSWFAQALWQRAINEHDDYRPGAQFLLDLGGRYRLTDRLSAMLQLNALIKGRDRGAEAEPEDTGKRSLSLSPGLSLAIGRETQVYAFLQQPLYQYVNGVQLTADWSATVGIATRF